MTSRKPVMHIGSCGIHKRRGRGPCSICARLLETLRGEMAFDANIWHTRLGYRGRRYALRGE